MKWLIYRLRGGCLDEDWAGDDCRFWVDKYGIGPCRNCKRRWSLKGPR